MCHYSEGVASLSPGLPRIAATLGDGYEKELYPNGVPSFVVRRRRNPFRVDSSFTTQTQGSRESAATLGYVTQLLRSKRTHRNQHTLAAARLREFNQR
jgi:hypothetical protein